MYVCMKHALFFYDGAPCDECVKEQESQEMVDKPDQALSEGEDPYQALYDAIGVEEDE